MNDLYGSRELTLKEKRVASLVAQGMRNRDIAGIVGQTENGIRHRLHLIFDKVGVDNRTELALWYVHKKAEGKI